MVSKGIPVDEVSSHAYDAQFVKLPLSLGELIESNKLEQRRVHGLLHLAKTLDVDCVFEVLSVPYEGIRRFLFLITRKCAKRKNIQYAYWLNVNKTERTNLLLTPSMRAVPPRILVSRTNEPELAADSLTEKYLTFNESDK